MIFSCNRLILLSCVVLGTLCSASSRESLFAEHHLGILLKPHWPNELVTYAVVKEFNGKIIKSYKCDRRQFLLMATGHQRTEANPDAKNFIELFEVPLCEARYDTLMLEHEIYCPITDQLWKLRYAQKPGVKQEADTETGAESGWAKRKLSPDERQLNMLKEFGIESINDYAYGDNCVKLLRAVSDPNWVKEYSQ